MVKMVPNMSTIKVRLTIGDTTAEVEAPPEKIEEAVKTIVSALRSTQQDTIPKRQQTKAVTCRTVIDEMIGEGWMHAERTLSEVAAEIARRGYSYDRTAIAHVLLDLVRLGVLERRGEARRYVYIQSSASGRGQPFSAEKVSNTYESPSPVRE
ncbi:MAG: hypothetical protein QXI97_08495 [Nitrososphaerota archaeon]